LSDESSLPASTSPSPEAEAFDQAVAAAGGEKPPAAAPPPSAETKPAASSETKIPQAAELDRIPDKLLDQMIVALIEKLGKVRARRYAAGQGVVLAPADFDALNLTPAEKEEILSNLPIVTPYLQQYAQYFKWVALGFFALNVWDMTTLRVAQVAQALRKKQQPRRGGSRDDDEDDDYPE